MNDAGKADFEREYGDSTAAQIGRVGGNIVATLPMGGGLGTLVQAGGNALKVSKFVSPVAEAIASGGMRASGLSTIPGLAARSAGGAISGGFSSLLVDPESAASGALFGAAMPVAAPVAALAAPAAALATRVLPKHLLGVTTGTSAETIGAAFNAGKNKSQEFLDNMRGVVPIDEVKNAAKEGMLKLKNEIPVQSAEDFIAAANLERASQHLEGFTRTLSSGGNDAEAIKKLQALLQNSGSKGSEKTLSPAQLLSQKQGRDLVAAIAGQGLKSWTPNRLAADLLQKTNIATPLFTAGTMPPVAILQLLAAGGTSPRLVGELAYGAGRGAKVFNGLLTQPENRQVVADWFFRPLPSLLANNPLYER